MGAFFFSQPQCVNSLKSRGHFNIMFINTYIVIIMPARSHLQRPLNPGGGGVLPMWWVIHMCRGFDPLFSLWQDRARSFWGTFSHPPTAKLSFGVQKLPIFTKIDLFGRKFNFFLDLFGSNFQRPAAHPHQFSGRVPPPTPGVKLTDSLLCKCLWKD